jgi:hypothetical protein
MKPLNVLAIIMVAIFFFASTGFCNDAEHEDSASSHCIMCCASGCNTFVQQNSTSFTVFSKDSTVFPLHESFYQQLVMREIFRPPKTF